MISKALSPKMCLDDQIAQVEAGIVIIERKVGTVSAEVTVRVG